MALGIDLYRTDDYRPYGHIGLIPLLQAVFASVLGHPLDGARFILTFHAVADQTELDGAPSVVNLRRSHGYVQVRIVRNGVTLYQHPHSLREIVARPLQRALAEQVPEETHWGFGIVGPGLESVALVRPAPTVRGSMDVTTGADRPSVFHLEEVPEPEPPETTLAELGLAGGVLAGDARVAVVLDTDVYEGLIRDMPFSASVEDGGFLAGQVFRDGERPDRYLVRVTGALAAERTGASLLHFTFTGESFLRVTDLIARRQRGERLVGWYHTHLFAATEALGLSTIDIDLHASTFGRSWQVAGLVNIDGSSRVLRFYRRQDDTMAAAPFWVLP
jgi:hypothetical protein